MLTMTTYRFKPFLTKAETKAVLDAFAKFGTAPGTISHYVLADGRGGVVIGESDSAAEGYRNILNYTEWVEYETTNLLTVEDAVPLVLDSLE